MRRGKRPLHTPQYLHVTVEKGTRWATDLWGFPEPSSGMQRAYTAQKGPTARGTAPRAMIAPMYLRIHRTLVSHKLNIARNSKGRIFDNALIGRAPLQQGVAI